MVSEKKAKIILKIIYKTQIIKNHSYHTLVCKLSGIDIMVAFMGFSIKINDY